MSLEDIIDWVEENPRDAGIRIFALERENIILERENAELRQQIAALGEIACLNLDDSTVAKCDAITDGEKYRDVMHRILVDQPKEIAELREDKERLDSGMIRLRAFSEWGNEWCLHTRLDLRAAIDAARKEAKP